MKYYEVKAKCGHVGRKSYIIKTFYKTAENGVEAAEKTRRTPRVKHHQKDAIISVKEITKDEYVSGCYQNSTDMYFQVTNSSDQRRLQAVDDSEVIEEKETHVYKKHRNYSKQAIIEMLFIKEWKTCGGYLYE